MLSGDEDFLDIVVIHGDAPQRPVAMGASAMDADRASERSFPVRFALSLFGVFHRLGGFGGDSLFLERLRRVDGAWIVDAKKKMEPALVQTRTEIVFAHGRFSIALSRFSFASGVSALALD